MCFEGTFQFLHHTDNLWYSHLLLSYGTETQSEWKWNHPFMYLKNCTHLGKWEKESPIIPVLELSSTWSLCCVEELMTIRLSPKFLDGIPLVAKCTTWEWNNISAWTKRILQNFRSSLKGTALLSWLILFTHRDCLNKK